MLGIRLLRRGLLGLILLAALPTPRRIAEARGLADLWILLFQSLENFFRRLRAGCAAGGLNFPRDFGSFARYFLTER